MALTMANLGLLHADKVVEYWKKAEFHYRESIKGNKDYANPYYGLSMLLINYYEKKIDQTKLQEALSLTNHYITLQNHDPMGYFAQARIYYLLGQKLQSVESYKIVLGMTKEKTYEYKTALKNIKLIMQELADGK
jgi:tetratricopeptide (TPR) repeat protein